MEVKNCLIIDDDIEIREVLCAVIDSYKLFHSVVQAKDGVEGRFKAQMQDFTTIITDLDMPKKNGLELIEELLIMNQIDASKIIVMSSEITTGTFVKLKSLGVDKILIKPFNSAKLIALIKASWGI